MSERRPSALERVDEVVLARGFAVLAALTFCLIVVGSLVRAHDAGLACPDWPLCKGEVVPPFDLKVAFEWGHRVFAGSISLGLFALSWLGLRRPSLRERLIPRLLVVWTILLVQIVFGGLTVLLLLAPWTVSAHLVLGNSFCLTLLWISRDLYESFGGDRAPVTISPGVPLLVAIVAVCLGLQIILGGLVSSHYAGLACTTFPTCNGESIAPTFQGLIGMHVIHRLNGFALLAAVGSLAWMTRRQGRMGMLAWLALCLVLLQIFVGVVNVQLRLPFAITALHTGLAAAIVLTSAMMVRDVVGARRAFPDRIQRARVAEAR
jgi:cytochrome c oxidase assembly protein subunit 15